jgi:hypothetical protein
MYNLNYTQLWGYKVEEKLYLGVREQKRLKTTGLAYRRRAVLYSWRYAAPSTINSLYLGQQIFRLSLILRAVWQQRSRAEFVLAYRKCLLIPYKL